jgi:predicted DCC family thiol-disulfide oxidoreductase YuxK
VEPAIVLLFDGLCAVCNRAVRFVLARDPEGTMRFAPLQGETARAIRTRHPALAGVDALVLIERGQGSDAPDRVWVGSDAVLRIAEYLGGPWRSARVLRLVPHDVREGAYHLFAAWRHRLLGRPLQVPIPDARTRERFLP